MLPEDSATESDDVHAWLHWGPYLSERQWGTVREDRSADGDAWNSVTHDMARSYAFRWGEEGIAGISDDHQTLCLALALWNGHDPILKERLFGLSNSQGNHGEDVKEVYHYRDNLPTHRYMRMDYRYPQAAFPYAQLVAENARRDRTRPEFEIGDTGVFAEGRYFDIEIEIAKEAPRDILVRYTVHNRGPEDAPLHLLPTLWFRADPAAVEPATAASITVANTTGDNASLALDCASLGAYHCYFDGECALLLTDNATNPGRIRTAADASVQALSNAPDGSRPCFKDGINDRVVDGDEAAVYPAGGTGTKAAAWFQLHVPAGGSASVRLRLSSAAVEAPFDGFDTRVAAQATAAAAFYATRQNPAHSEDRRAVQRQAWAGLLWNKQFYCYDVSRWLDGEPGAALAPARTSCRNTAWRHVRAHDIILMPDKWEYPWFAAWDLAFHCIALAPIDPAFAKRQITLLLHDRYMHPDGQLPAYEWNFSDVNPPVQALAAWKIYQADAAATGRPDTAFLQHVLHRLMLNFTWWVNREDSTGNNIFEGGFLGLDNIGVFDRSAPVPGLAGGQLEQADGSSWMAMYALNLMRIAMELALTHPVYEDLAIKFTEHFFYIAGAMANIGNVEGEGLWDEEDGFFYDMLRLPDGSTSRLRLRTIVGLIPLFALEVMDDAKWTALTRLRTHIDAFLKQRPDLAALVSNWHARSDAPGARDSEPNEARTGGLHLFSLLRGHRLKMLLQRMLDPQEFLSPNGIRSVSRVYSGEHGFDYLLQDTHYALHYTPAESDSAMFGGNSNWRGPVWMPLNYLIVESLRRFHAYFGDDFQVECPTGSGQLMSLNQVADFLRERLLALFLPGDGGRRPYQGPSDSTAAPRPDDLLFHEYFDGDTGKGLGASHQTGWTALIAVL